MNCADVQERLSAYHDGELPGDVAAQIAAHLANCPACATELESFESLSALTRKLTDPAAPKQLWTKLEARLDQDAEARTPIKGPTRKSYSFTRLAAAAMILIALTFGAYRIWQTGHTHQNVAANFDRYFTELKKQPNNAEQVLLANYEGRVVTVTEATRTLGYEPLVAQGLPPNCSLEKMYLLNMPCCKCTLALCRQGNGEQLAVFEHDTERPGWFGNRATIDCLCEGVPTSITQVNDKLAATWKDGKRYMTIIGAKDLNDVSEFIAFYRKPGRTGDVQTQ